MDTLVKSAACQQISKMSDSLFGPLEAATSGLDAQFNSIKALLDTINFSPGKMIHDMCQDLLKNTPKLDSMIPSINKMDELVDIINSCLFLSGNDMFKNPLSILNNMYNDMLGQVNGIIDDLTGNLPEFKAGQMLNALLNNIKLGNLTPSINNLLLGLNCLDKVCGIDTTSRMQRLQSFLTKYCFNGSGEFDLDKFLTDCGLDPEKRDIIKMTQKCIDQIYKRVETAFDNAKNAVTGEFDKITNLAERTEAQFSSLYQKGKDLFEDPPTVDIEGGSFV